MNIPEIAVREDRYRFTKIEWKMQASEEENRQDEYTDKESKPIDVAEVLAVELARRVAARGPSSRDRTSGKPDR